MSAEDSLETADMRHGRARVSPAVEMQSAYETQAPFATSQCVWIERKGTAEAIVFERLVSHALDDIRRLCEKFVPPPISVNLREQNGADCFLFFFRKLLRSGIGFVKKVCHGGHSNPSPSPVSMPTDTPLLDTGTV